MCPPRRTMTFISTTHSRNTGSPVRGKICHWGSLDAPLGDI